MNPFVLPSEVDVDQILSALSLRQHLRPHETVENSLKAMVGALGVCPDAVASAITWLGLDRARCIGRLRRTELVQLVRAIHRNWAQNVRESVAKR